MQLVLTEDQELLAKTAADWVAEKSPLSRVRALRDDADPDGFSRALWSEMAELGWLGIPFPEHVGGADMGVAELAVILEALGRTLAPEPFIGNVMLAGGVLLRAAGEDAQRQWLPGLCSGEAFLALAQQEKASRFDLHRVATRAERTASGYRLRGEKSAVLDATLADAIVVVARTAGDDAAREGISLFLVPSDTPGVRVTKLHRVDGRNAGLVTLTAAEVRAEALIGTEGAGLAPLEAAVGAATVALCAEMLGSMSEAFDRTIAYLRDREQFGVPIGSFQALKHRAADLFTEIELCRSSVMAAARAVDGESDDASRLVSLAKARCSDTGIAVANEAIQMHGGIGMTDEHDIGFYLKRARVAELTLGDASWHRDRWALLSGY